MRVMGIAVFICVLFALSAHASAQEAARDSEGGMSDAEFCKLVSTLASKTMEARQAGVPMANMMDIALKNGGEMSGVGQTFVEMAYSKPRYTSDEFIEREITEFGNEAYVACLRARRK